MMPHSCSGIALERTSLISSQNRHLTVCVLIDALGWEILRGRSFLNELLTYRQSVRTVLGFSSGAIPSLLTGKHPDQHGHWNLFYYDPAGSPFAWLRALDRMPQTLLNHRITQKIIKELGRRVFHMGPQFECYVRPSLMPYFNWVERRCIYEPGGISGARSIFDDLVTAGLPYKAYSYHHWNDEAILELAQKDVDECNAGFFFIYLCQLDAELHSFWTHPDRLGSVLDRYEERLQRIFETALRIDPDASIAVFSDHGMAPVTERIDLVKKIDELGWKMPDHYLAVYDSTMARFWYFDEGARSSIRDCLHAQTCGQILSDAELQELGVYFADRRYGESIFLLNRGYMFYRSDFHSGNWLPNGMHGYHPDDPYSDGVFLSNQQPTSPLHSIRDIHSYMERVSGIENRNNPGGRNQRDKALHLPECSIQAEFCSTPCGPGDR